MTSNTTDGVTSCAAAKLLHALRELLSLAMKASRGAPRSLAWGGQAPCPRAMTLDEAIKATLQKWSSQGVHFRPGASAESIQLFEQTYGVVMPTDLRRLFQTADGMGGAEMWEEDSDMLAFWPLPTSADLASPDARITHVAPLPLVWSSAPEFLQDLFIIGDWSILCFAFCARIPSARSDTTEIYFYDGDPPSRIASSLKEFLQRYVEHGLDALWPTKPNVT